MESVTAVTTGVPVIAEGDPLKTNVPVGERLFTLVSTRAVKVTLDPGCTTCALAESVNVVG